MDPFSGTWIANIAKSKRHQNHQFQSATLRFDVSGDEIALTQSGVNMSGKAESRTLMFQADGRTLTAKVYGIDAQGAAFEQEIVFDRAS